MGKRVAVAQGRRSRAKTHHDPSPVGEMAAGTISCGEETLHTHGWRPDGARLSCERAYGRGAPDPRRPTRGAAPLGRSGAHLGPPGGRRLQPRPPPADRPPGRRLHPPQPARRRPHRRRRHPRPRPGGRPRGGRQPGPLLPRLARLPAPPLRRRRPRPGPPRPPPARLPRHPAGLHPRLALGPARRDGGPGAGGDRAGQLPRRGGQRPHLALTATLETLRGDRGAPAAWLNWTFPISGTALRRLARETELTPMPVDG